MATGGCTRCNSAWHGWLWINGHKECILRSAASMLGISHKLYVLVEALIFIAYNGDAHPLGGKKLATILHVAPRYLEPLLQALVRAQILRSTRGPRGGYTLARERRQISLDEVLLAMEYIRSDRDTPPRFSHANETLVQPLFAHARGAYIHELGRYTLEDICAMVQEADLKSTFLVQDHEMVRYDFSI
ncbi:MAG: Rrf2 family transcriptional regulator [Alphaproteobacteria bacterium]|nr:MAG: Rrf2 family transcriptional regulator [Alphaproteobacteria bacterium]TAF14296.1 MAG: Rrf2 family transcriptional regulator [Alphaproteobacteria bacterium]TAF40444.1 MAG: Rrf2 family transcriptional regulator [Alphaproteobacteria bacterium]TAF76484.1 MAG: Rrf2 family transcriptional regulator [Alphaproteobacteria bacterium]